MGGKYQHPTALNYQLDNKSYPAFDKDGYYIGWSNKTEGYLIGSRTSDESTRKWNIFINDLPTLVLVQDDPSKSALPKPVTDLVFDTSGKLQSLVRRDSGITSTYPCTAQSIVKFTLDNKTEWTFRKGLFDKVNYRTTDSSYRATEDNYMSFTKTPYHFTFNEDGYLQSYRRTNDPIGTVRTDIGTDWTCEKDVYYYGSAYDAYYDKPFNAKYQGDLHFSYKNGEGYYIDNLIYSYRGIYAKINDYYFYSDGTNGWRLVTMHG